MRMYMDKVCWIWILLHNVPRATGIPTSGRTDGNIPTVSGYVQVVVVHWQNFPSNGT